MLITANKRILSRFNKLFGCPLLFDLPGMDASSNRFYLISITYQVIETHRLFHQGKVVVHRKVNHNFEVKKVIEKDLLL